jgi:quinol monooxygenase YgiN
MSVYAVWESYCAPDDAPEGRAVTQAIWRDMEGFVGYVSHELVEDLDDPGHLLVIGEWVSRGDADAAVRAYARRRNARRMNELVSRPRTRFVGRPVTPPR